MTERNAIAGAGNVVVPSSPTTSTLTGSRAISSLCFAAAPQLRHPDRRDLCARPEADLAGVSFQVRCSPCQQ